MKQSKKISNLFLRYLTILLIGTGNLYIIYKILTPLTIQTTNLILSIFTKTTLIGNTILLDQGIIEIAPACISGSAFYLILILILSTANIKPKVRIKALLTALIALFTLNITRILILTSLSYKPYFETIHWVFWHIISTIFVIVIWFLTIKFYKIKSIPIYDDFKYMRSLMK